MNQWWNIVNWTLRNKLQWNFNLNLIIFIQENAFQNVVWYMTAILSRPQWVNCSGIPANAPPIHIYHPIMAINLPAGLPAINHMVTVVFCVLPKSLFKGPMDDEQALNQVTSHYLNHSLQISMQSYSITKLQWVTAVHGCEENMSILIHFSTWVWYHHKSLGAWLSIQIFVEANNYWPFREGNRLLTSGLASQRASNANSSMPWSPHVLPVCAPSCQMYSPCCLIIPFLAARLVNRQITST